jgi:hypothetical protein
MGEKAMYPFRFFAQSTVALIVPSIHHCWPGAGPGELTPNGLLMKIRDNDGSNHRHLLGFVYNFYVFTKFLIDLSVEL